MKRKLFIKASYKKPIRNVEIGDHFRLRKAKMINKETKTKGYIGEYYEIHPSELSETDIMYFMKKIIIRDIAFDKKFGDTVYWREFGRKDMRAEFCTGMPLSEFHDYYEKI